MAGVVGIEPTMMVLETIVIPFNYTPVSSTLILYLITILIARRNKKAKDYLASSNLLATFSQSTTLKNFSI